MYRRGTGSSGNIRTLDLLMSLTLVVRNNIATIIFDHPESKVNILTSEVMKNLNSILEEIKGKSSLEAVIFLSAKKDIFIAGADIKEIEEISDPKEGEKKSKLGQEIFNKIEDLAIPTIALMDGAALGGGCELALACQYRLATFNEKVKIGLPEVGLGILPGFGGVYRLPRIIGLQEGLKMILSGRPVDGKKALKIGLVDRLIPKAREEAALGEFIVDIKNKKIPSDKFHRRRQKGFKKWQEESVLVELLTFYQAKKNILKNTKGFYPAPLQALSVVRDGFYLNRPKALALESKAFGELVSTAVCKNLIHVFYLSEKFKKLKPQGSEQIVSPSIERAVVLGAGIMGGGIAQLLSSQDIWVRMKDINAQALVKGLQAASKLYREGMKKKRFTQAEAKRKMAHISTTLDDTGFGRSDLVIEAVMEDMALKKKIFHDLSQVITPKAVLATNTSALSVTEMAQETKDPSKVIGIHFFNPVHRMPLVEIITTQFTSLETTLTALEFVRRLGKTPILVKDSCGFLVNRILLSYINEAGRILEECGQMEKIDHLATDFGLPMGPFTLTDEVGLDVGSKVLHTLQAHWGDRFKSVEIFEKIYAQGHLGKKSGKGFYVHASKIRKPNPQVGTLLKGHFNGSFKEEEYRKRMIYIMINEAAMCLKEGIVEDAAAIDVGMIFGIGFPPFRGGLLRYADTLGIDRVVEDLQELREKTGSERFHPVSYLLQLKEQKRGFYHG